MADPTTLYTMLHNVYIDITIFNITWLLSIPLVIGTSLIITRDKNAQGYLWLPLTIIYHVVGIKPSYVWYIIVTIVFIFKIFSTDTIGNLIWTQTRQGIQEAYHETEGYKKKARKGLLSKIFGEEMERRDKQDAKKLTREELYNAIMRGKGR